MAAAVNQREQNEASIDSILEELGFGKFQILSLFYLLWPMFFNSFVALNFVFATLDTEYRCDIPECSSNEDPFKTDWLQNTIPYENGEPVKCERYILNTSVLLFQSTNTTSETCSKELFLTNETETCKNWVFGEGQSIVKEFNIPCQTWKRTLVGTVNSFGQFISLSYSGFVSDAIGRRNVVILTTAFCGIIGVIQSFSPEYWSFLFLEFLNSAINSGTYASAFILGVELLQPKNRIMGTTFLMTVCGVATVILGLIAWVVPYWKDLLRFTYAPSLLAFFGFWFLPESIRWMYVKGKNVKCVQTIKEAARMNKVTLSENSNKFLNDLIKCELDTKNSLPQDNVKFKKCEEEKTISLCGMLKSYTLLIRFIICSLCWIVNAVVYYGLILNSVSFIRDNNPYLNFILVTAIDLPSNLLYLVALDKLGRRLSLFLSLLGCGIACIIFPFLPNGRPIISLLTYLMGKLFITMSFSVIYIYTSELFPTSLRNTTVSCCSMIGRIGCMLAPQTPLLAVLYPPLPMLAFGFASIASAISILIFPETSKIKLPDTIQEAEKIGKFPKQCNENGEARW